MMQIIINCQMAYVCETDQMAELTAELTVI